MRILLLSLVVSSPCWASDVPTERDRWVYAAEVQRVVDADTVDLVVSLGFGVRIKERFRMLRISAPELQSANGRAGARWLKNLIEGRRVLVRTLKDKRGKWRRYLAEVYYEGRNVNDWVMEAGHAVYED